MSEVNATQGLRARRLGAFGIATASILGLLAAGGGAAAAEAPDTVVYAGASGGQAQAGFAGVVRALPGSSLGKGWAVRATALAGQYDYAKGATNIRGEFKSGQLALVRQTSGRWGYASLSAGPTYTHTTLDPIDADNPRRGGHWDAFVQTDGGLKNGPVQVDWSAGYAFGGENYDASLGATVKLGGLPARAGVMGLISGDRAYRSQGVGGLLGITPRPGLGINLIAGSIDAGNGEKGAFGTVVVSKAF